jgi:hypothetical protein
MESGRASFLKTTAKQNILDLYLVI